MSLDARPSDAELLARPHAKGCACLACWASGARIPMGFITPDPAFPAHDPKCLCRSCYHAALAAKRKPTTPSPAIILTLPVPPSSNRWHRHVNGRAILSEAARKYTKLVKERMAERRMTPITGPVQVEIWWHRARKSGDLDKRVSILLDALQGAAYVADSQIEELHAYRLEDKANPRVEVRVTAIPPPPTP